MKPSPRQELDIYVGSGNLRHAVERHNTADKLSPAAIELLVNVVARYCAPRRRRR